MSVGAKATQETIVHLIPVCSLAVIHTDPNIHTRVHDTPTHTPTDTHAYHDQAHSQKHQSHPTPLERLGEAGAGGGRHPGGRVLSPQPAAQGLQALLSPLRVLYSRILLTPRVNVQC